MYGLKPKEVADATALYKDYSLGMRKSQPSEDGTLWKVPYRLLKVREPIQEPAMTQTSEIDTLGNQLLQEHEDKSDLSLDGSLVLISLQRAVVYAGTQRNRLHSR